MKPFFLAGVLAAALPAIVITCTVSPFPASGYGIGLTASLVNGALAYVTNRASIGREMNTFMVRAFLGHGTRLALIAGFIAGAILNEYPDLKPILITLGIGYISFLFSEIAMLHSRLYSSRSIFPKTES